MWVVGMYFFIFFEYDEKVVISLIMTIYDVLNPIVQTCKSLVDESIVESSNFIEENNNIFSVGASIEKFSCAFVGQLYSFKRLFITPTTCVDPLLSDTIMKIVKCWLLCQPNPRNLRVAK
jgi:hypothetical protein